jgi:hypothetical protein
MNWCILSFLTQSSSFFIKISRFLCEKYAKLSIHCSKLTSVLSVTNMNLVLICHTRKYRLKLPLKSMIEPTKMLQCAHNFFFLSKGA